MNPHEISMREAFDRHAGSYDERFSRPALGEAIRQEVWRIADRAFASAERVLDLGSGTGEDVIHLAKKGMRVTAVDLSSRMIAQIQAKASAAGVAPKVECLVREMNLYEPAEQQFDGILSNFGALNCLPDIIWLRSLAERGLKPGSRIVLVTMGRLYPLETAVLSLKGQFGRAFRRLRKPCEVSIEGVPVQVHYHSLKAMRTMLGAQFRLEQVQGLRAMLPVPGWEHLGHSALFRGLAPLDRNWCRFRLTAEWADHFISVWRFDP